MKISEFAQLSQVTTKMLRHYDEIGLFKPSLTDPVTGYRSYEAGQMHHLNWIIILKNLDFPLLRIKELLSGPVGGDLLVRELIAKRVEISSAMNEQTQKKISINQLIILLEKEGFKMNQPLNILNLTPQSVHEIKKNIPNMEMFLDDARDLAAACQEGEPIAVFRLDISHFKQVNDRFGFETGDQVIVAFYNILKMHVSTSFPGASISRAHGDEFIVVAKADRQNLEEAAAAIILDIRSFDFAAIGCPLEMGCYIGGLVGSCGHIPHIRGMIEETMEAIEQARRKGVCSVVVNLI